MKNSLAALTFLVVVLVLRVATSAAETPAESIAALKQAGAVVNEIKPDQGASFCDVYFDGERGTDADFVHLAAIGPIRHLHLKGPETTAATLRILTKCQKIEHLVILNTKLTGTQLAPLAKIPGLTELTIDGQIGKAGIAAVAAAPQLESVYFFSCTFTPGMLAELGACKRLKSLWVDANITDAQLAELEGCQQLEALHISRFNSTGDGAKSLAKLPRLTSLTLNGAFEFEDADLAPFATLTQVKSLSISGFNLTDACLPHLAQLKQLEELSLYTSKVSQAGGDKLRAALPKCLIRGFD